MYGVATIAALAASWASSAAAAAPSTCNGFAELCPLPYSSVAFATTHNAYAVGPYPAANQKNPIQRQLQDGIRGLMLDIMYPSSTDQSQIYLCHTDCSLLSAGPLTNTLKVIADFLNQNPNEVVTILFENYDILPEKIRESFVAAGLDSFAFVPPSPTEWPTLGDMISQNKRLVVFTDKGADTNVVNWLLPEYDYVWETPFQVSSESNFTCDIDRPKGQSRPTYVLNHFLYGEIQFGSAQIPVPLPGSAKQINTGSSLLYHASRCAESAGHSPSFLAVDFYQDGDVLQAAATLNNIKNYKPPPGAGVGTTKQSAAARSARASPGDLVSSGVCVALVAFATLVKAIGT